MTEFNFTRYSDQAIIVSFKALGLGKDEMAVFFGDSQDDPYLTDGRRLVIDTPETVFHIENVTYNLTVMDWKSHTVRTIDINIQMLPYGFNYIAAATAGEDLMGTQYRDRLTGMGDAFIFGGGGDDSIRTGGGTNTVDGGKGDDYLDLVGDVHDTIMLNRSSGHDRLYGDVANLDIVWRGKEMSDAWVANHTEDGVLTLAQGKVTVAFNQPIHIDF